MATLPYVTATGNIERALTGIKQAATPTTVSQDFVKTILGIQGGSGNQMTAFLRKIGFVASDGSPTSIYTRFRSPDAQTSGAAVAEALKVGYAPLYRRNEYMHKLSDDKLKGLIIEETGSGGDSTIASMLLNCIKAIKKFADFDALSSTEVVEVRGQEGAQSSTARNGTANDREEFAGSPGDLPRRSGLGLNLAYTINLNLPATSDIAVFNAIFKSLKENLL